MPPSWFTGDYEIIDARVWEEESSIADPQETREPQGVNQPVIVNNGRHPTSTQADAVLVDISSSSIGQHQVGPNPTQGFHNSFASGRSENRQSNAANQPRSSCSAPDKGSSRPVIAGDDRAFQDFMRAKSNRDPTPTTRPRQSSRSRYSEETSTTKSTWAESPDLETKRVFQKRGKEQRVHDEGSIYLRRPAQDLAFAVTGYFLWPNKDENAFELLGPNLEDLNTFRIAHKVLIDWIEDKRCLRINSQEFGNVTAAIKSIRQAIRSAHARAIVASPLFIVEVPNVCISRSSVLPRYEGQITRPIENGTKYPDLIGFKLSDTKYSPWELAKWKEDRVLAVNKNRQVFQDRFFKYMDDLSHYKGWLRMRVHFGHLELKHYRQAFVDSENGFSFNEFTKMLAKSRTSGVFNKRIDDDSIGMKMVAKFADYSDKFFPFDYKTFKLKDVKPKHAIVFFIDSTHLKFRLEAEIDVVDGVTKGKYQFGTTHLFRNDQRNQRIQITSIDVEKQLDWTLEVISDNSEPTIPSQFMSLLDSCLCGSTEERTDILGLPYPGINPAHPQGGFTVSSVVLKSVSQYKTQPGGYTVDVTIYREWDGYKTTMFENGMKTNIDPKIKTSVSMWHPDWENEMASNEGTTREREWDRQLAKLFPRGGLSSFLDDVQLVHGMLAASAKDFSLLD